MTDQDQIRALQNSVRQLEQQVGILEDTHAIRDLQHKYGYYLDRCLYDEVVDLMSEAGKVYFFGGVFQGKAGARRLFCDRFRNKFTGGHNGPIFGLLLEHAQLQDVIHVAPDRQTAQGRFRYFLQGGRHEAAAGETSQWWEGGVYENTYIKEDGVWKFEVLSPRVVWQADYETGWAHTKPQYVTFFTDTFPANPAGPDALEEPRPVLWPATEIAPFHYPHPVTGKWVK